MFLDGITMQENQKFNLLLLYMNTSAVKYHTSKKIMDSEENDMTNTETETEKIVMPAKHFHALIDNKDTAYNQIYRESITLAGDLKASKEKMNIYEKALQNKTNKCELLEKELTVHKGKYKTSAEFKTQAEKMAKCQEKFNEVKPKLIQDYYEKNHQKEIEELKKRFGV